MNTETPVQGTLPLLQDAPVRVRQAILEAYLTWLECGGHQTRQIHGWLYGDGEQCCAMGALGRLLEAHGYARVKGGHLITAVRLPDGRVSTYASRAHLSPAVLRALGLQDGGHVITALSDTQGASFTQIAQTLRALKLRVPA